MVWRARLHILVGECLLRPLGRGRARGAALDGWELAARARFRAARIRALARRLSARLERLDVRRLEVRGAVGGVDIEEEVRPLPLCLALLLALLEAEAARRAAGQLRERPPPLHAGEDAFDHLLLAHLAVLVERRRVELLHLQMWGMWGVRSGVT